MDQISSSDLIKNESEASLSIELFIGQTGNYQLILISNIDKKVIQSDPSGDLFIYPILKFIHDKHNNLDHTMISCCSASKQVYVYLGNYPLSSDQKISAKEFISAPLTLKLKARYSNEYEPSNSFTLGACADEDADSDTGAKGSKRTKERKIGFIIEKVARWRNLYNGVQNNNGENVRLTLEESAIKVDISKKSLDDYLLQLRFGRKYGFNFEEHKNDKVGLLRAYVKKFKQIQGELSKLAPGEQPSSDILEMINQKGTPACRSKKCCVPPSGILKIPN